MDGRSTLAIQTAGLTKKFKHAVAVDGLDLEIGSGQVFGLVGPNGAGKTTTIRMLLGLATPTAGTITILNERVPQHFRRIAHRLGALLENPGFVPSLSGRKNLAYLQLASGRPVDRKQIDAVLELAGIAGRAGDRLHDYSHGMKQRLGLASALLSDPELIIMDEPHTGLDPTGHREFRDLIRRMNSEGKTLMISSHLLSEVEEICSHIGFMHHGHLVGLYEVDALRRRAQTVKVVTPKLARALEICRSKGWTVTEFDAWLEVQGASRDEVRDTLAGAGLSPLEATATGKPLEDLYHELTGQALDPQ